MTLSVDEFRRRFLLYLLSPGFVCIRNFGFLANRKRAVLLPLCFRLLDSSAQRIASAASPSIEQNSLPLELPSLRRNHAPCRRAFRRAAPAPLHLNQNSTQHDPLSTSLASVLASARSQIPCLICPGLLGSRSLQPSINTSSRRPTATSHRQNGTPRPTHPVPDPSAPAQIDAKYIAIHEGGFLQVAVSEAPRSVHAAVHRCVAGAPDTALRHIGTEFSCKVGG
jgi:hypothetical protein